MIISERNFFSQFGLNAGKWVDDFTEWVGFRPYASKRLGYCVFGKLLLESSKLKFSFKSQEIDTPGKRMRLCCFTSNV